MNTTTITLDYMRDLVRDAGLDWNYGFDNDGDNRYAKLIWNTIAAEEKRSADYVAGMHSRIARLEVQVANVAELKARIAQLEAGLAAAHGVKA
jgi:hypothetical protein